MGSLCLSTGAKTVLQILSMCRKSYFNYNRTFQFSLRFRVNHLLQCGRMIYEFTCLEPILSLVSIYLWLWSSQSPTLVYVLSKLEVQIQIHAVNWMQIVHCLKIYFPSTYQHASDFTSHGFCTIFLSILCRESSIFIIIFQLLFLVVVWPGLS